jgi:hypothetical protein
MIPNDLSALFDDLIDEINQEAGSNDLFPQLWTDVLEVFGNF